MPYAAVDVHYPPDGGATAAIVVAADRRFAHIHAEHVVHLDRVAPYQPGAFYLRELPAVEAAVEAARQEAGQTDLLIVDGYVTLDSAGRKGLGAHAHDRLGVPVIGVAKTAFRGATHAVEVRRGGTRPLYVTAAGMAPADAAALVADMAGPHRLPDALRRVDRLCRCRNVENITRRIENLSCDGWSVE